MGYNAEKYQDRGERPTRGMLRHAWFYRPKQSPVGHPDYIRVPRVHQPTPDDPWAGEQIHYIKKGSEAY